MLLTLIPGLLIYLIKELDQATTFSNFTLLPSPSPIYLIKELDFLNSLGHTKKNLLCEIVNQSSQTLMAVTMDKT